MSNNDGSLVEVDDDKFSSIVIHHRSICFARSHSNWGHIKAARLRESGVSDADEPGTRRRCARRESHGGSTDPTCSELGHLSCHCLLQRDRIYSDVPTLSSPPQINRSGRI